VKAEELKENIKQEEITAEKIDVIIEDLGILDLQTKSNETIETKEESEKELKIKNISYDLYDKNKGE